MSPSLTLIYLFLGESDFQGRLWCWFSLHPVPHLRRLWHAPTVQVRPGTVPQHSGLLHIASHWEEDLHPLHGGLLCCLHLNVHLWDDLPHLQTRTEIHQEEAWGREEAVCRESRDGTAGSTQVRVQVQNISQSGPYSLCPKPQKHRGGDAIWEKIMHSVAVAMLKNWAKHWREYCKQMHSSDSVENRCSATKIHINSGIPETMFCRYYPVKWLSAGTHTLGMQISHSKQMITEEVQLFGVSFGTGLCCVDVYVSVFVYVFLASHKFTILVQV